MRTLFTFLIFNLSFLIFNSNAQWVELDPGVDDALYDIYAITPDIAVAVGFNGTIIKTTDGGETWQQKDSGTTTTLLKVQFPTPEIGYITSMEKLLLKTIDGGETWLPVNETSDCYYYDFSWVSEELIYNNCNGFFVKSIDGGQTWIDIEPASAADLQFKNSNIGYGINSSSTLMKTESGGETWMELNYIANPFQFLDENTGFFYFDGLYKTIDGGYNFELLGYGQGQIFSKIYIVDENNAWGIINGLLNGDGSTQGIVKVHILTDGTYTEEIWYDDDPTLDMASIHFADENTGYIVGYKDWKTRIWKNGTGINTMSTVEPTIDEIKVYPNPASEAVNIDLGKTISDTHIILIDLSGKQIFSKKYNGKNKISIDTKGFPKGVYTLSIRMTQKVVNKKIIIN